MKRDDVMKIFNPLVEGDVKHYPSGVGARVQVAAGMVTLRPRRGAQLLEMEKGGTQSLTKFVGLPLNIARAISPSTFGNCLSELLNGHGPYSVVMKDGRVTSVIPHGSKHTVHPERLMDIAEKAMPLRDYHRAMVIDNTIASLEVLGERTSPVRRGDMVRAGVKINFSPMGTVSPLVQSFGVILSCTNGATSNVVLSEYHGNGGGSEGGSSGDSNVWDFFRKSIRSAYNSFDQVVGEWRHLSNENIPPEQRAAMLEALIRRAQLLPEVADSVRAMAINRPPQNAWEMHNLITYASSHLLREPKRIVRAQQVAADFADETQHGTTCPMCRQGRAPIGPAEAS